MNELLEEIYELLDSFEAELSKIRAIWRQIEIDNPSFEQVSEENWQEKHARMWLHEATSVQDCNELERWLFDAPPFTHTAQMPAIKVYLDWKEWLETKGSFGAYYVDFDKFQIPRPDKEELLIDYVILLARLTEDCGLGHRLEWRALKSFLDFIRESYPVGEIAFIEHIFPKKMDVYFERIIRIIPPEAYPIPEKAASEILIELAQICRNHRRLDTRLTAAESLGLCWLCITASRLRLPTHIETVKEIELTAIQTGPDLPILQVPTWFGNRPVKISHLLSKFLNALSRIPSKQSRKSILQRPLRSLTRMFEEALVSVSPNPEYGNITYLSLLNQPHVFGDHRYQPKNLINK